MKKLLAYALLSIYILQGVSNIGIYLSFKINQDYIAKVLCINKDEPEKKCNGKCHLNKELKKAEEKRQETPAAFQLKELLQFFESSEIVNTFYPEIKNTNYNVYQQSFLPGNFIATIFHPPRKTA